MAKDDYHVIVYQILSYLYQCLKKGEAVSGKKLNYGSELLRINKSYWAYILYNMHCMGLIEGIAFVNLDGFEIPYATMLENTRITPAGIEYLCDNSFMEKAKQFLVERCTETGVSFNRNGKNEVVAMRELYGIMHGENILHTAHRTPTSHSAWERLCILLSKTGLKEGEDYKTLKQFGLEQITMLKVERCTETGVSFNLIFRNFLNLPTLHHIPFNISSVTL